MPSSVSHTGSYAIERSFGAQRAVLALEANGDRLQRGAGFQRRLEQRSVKLQQRRAVGRRAFGKDGEHIALAQRGAHQGIDSSGVVRARAANEKRPAARAEPTHQRPAPHFRLCDEAHRQDRVDREDIEPRNVIRYEKKGPRVARRAVDLQPHSEHSEQARRPAPDFVLAALRTLKWEKACGDEQPARKMEREPGDAGVHRLTQ